jgi:hypothetical protein
MRIQHVSTTSPNLLFLQQENSGTAFATTYAPVLVGAALLVGLWLFTREGGLGGGARRREPEPARRAPVENPCGPGCVPVSSVPRAMDRFGY